MKRFTKKAIILLLSLVMVLTMVPVIGVLFAPKAKAAVSRSTFVPDSTGAFIYCYSSDSSVRAPTWTDYAPSGYFQEDGVTPNTQDDIEWPYMESGSWTINGQSYNYRVHIDYANHRYEGGTYQTHFYSGSTYLGAITYYLDYVKHFNTEYYYTYGTNFVYQMILYYKNKSSNNDTAINWLTSHGWTHWGHNFNAGDGHKSSFVHSGYHVTTDPYVAIKRVLVADGHPQTLTYGGATYYAVGSGRILQTPAEGDGCVDLNDDNGGDDLYLMVTVDPDAGLPITALDMGQNSNSTNAQNALLNNGYTIATDQSGNYQDTNAGAGGDFNYVGYKSSVSTTVNSDTLRQLYAHRKWLYDNGARGNGLEDALNYAQIVLSDLSDGYTIFDQSVIDNGVNLLINAIPTLTVDSDVTPSLTAGGALWYQYTPSSNQNLLFITHAEFDPQYELYEGLLSQNSDHDMDDGASATISLLGMANYQVIDDLTLTANTTYYFKVFAYSSSASGTLPMRLATPVSVTFNATGGTSKTYKLPKGYDTMKLNSTGVTRSGHRVAGWSASNEGEEALWKLATATVSVPTSDKTYYALWYPNNPATLTVNSENTANITQPGEIHYYQFTPTETRRYLLYSTATQTKLDPFLLIYDDATYRSAATYLITNDDGGNNHHDFVGSANRNFYQEYTLEAGTKYLIGVKGYHFTSSSSNQPTGSYPFRFEAIYTVHYDANGGEGAPADADKYCNKDITLSSDEPTRDGYVFDGWSTSSTATSPMPAYAGGQIYSGNADLTLYAVWRPEVTFTASEVGYSVTQTPASNVALNGSVTFKITLDEAYSNSPYPSCTCTDTGSSVSASQNGNVVTYMISGITQPCSITVGNATINKYTVTFKNWDGTTLKTQSVNHGSDATPPATDPTKAADATYHYTFDGWSGNTNITSSKTITATFTPAAHAFDTFVQQTQAPTCTEPGAATYKCTGCDKTTSKPVQATGHSMTFNAAVSGTDCQHNGTVAYYYCSRCEKNFAEEAGTTELTSLDDNTPGPHSSVTDPAVPATCTEPGLTEGSHCSLCNTVLTAQTTVQKDLTNHDGGTEVRDDLAATCHTKGYTGDTYCLGCGEKIATGTEIDFDSSNHDGDTEVRDDLAATCHTKGYTGDTYCLGCGEKIATGTEIDFDADNHDGGTEVRGAFAATCHTKGYTGDTYCLGCNTKIADGTEIDFDANNHDGDTEVRGAFAATCHTKGYTGDTYCLGCNTKIADGTEIDFDASNHDGDTEVRGAFAATCHTKGYTGDTYCLGCNTKIADGTEIDFDANNHDGDTEVRGAFAATCHTKGYTGDTYCLGCNTKIADGTEIDFNADNHDGETEVRGAFAATCHTKGYTGDTYCLGCNTKIATGTEIDFDSTNHDGDTEVRGAFAATCHTKGYTGDTYCLGCGEKIATGTEIDFDASNHDGETEVRGAFAATCHTKGYTGDTYCLGCNTKTADGTEIDFNANNHDGETKVRGAFAATCHTKGYTGDTYCLGCNTKIATGTEIDFDSTNHEGDTEVRGAFAATCHTKGYTGDTYCLGCNTKIATGTEIDFDSTNHDGGTHTEVENEVPATCTVPGSYSAVEYCYGCNQVVSREDDIEIPAPGHTPDAAVTENFVDSTCTAEGSYDTVVYCVVCRDELSRTPGTVAMKDHTPGDPVKENEVAATCTENGSYDIAVYCTVCTNELSRDTYTIPAGHTAGEPVKENETDPTCAEPGSYEAVVYCTVCGDEISRNAVEIPALGHDWSEWQTVTAPTVAEPGVARRICFRCSEIETQEIPSLEAPKDRKVQFVVSGSMHYVVYMDDVNYEIYSKTTPAIMWYKERALTFSVVVHDDWVGGYLVSLNGEELKPNYDGTYTIPAGADYAKINCYPVATTATVSENEVCAYCGQVHPNSIWGRIVAFFHMIFWFLTRLFRR